MANVTVIGAQWGDEGKGKVIDWLANRADVVVRFQGGNNAGHTIVVGNSVYKFSLLPSGVVQGKLSIIGNGVVVDPWSLLDEIERVRAQGLDIKPRGWSSPTTPASSCRCIATSTRRARPTPGPTGSAPRAAASAQPTRTRSGGGRSGFVISPTRMRSSPRSSGCWPTTAPCDVDWICPR